MRVSCASWPPTRRTSVSVRGRRTGKSAANPIALKRSERATGRAGCVERLCAIGTKRVVDARDRLVAASPLYGPRPSVAASRPGPARAATRSGRTPAAALDRQQPPRAPSRLPCVDLTARRNPQAVWQTHARIPRAKGGRREWRRDARRAGKGGLRGCNRSPSAASSSRPFRQSRIGSAALLGLGAGRLLGLAFGWAALERR